MGSKQKYDCKLIVCHFILVAGLQFVFWCKWHYIVHVHNDEGGKGFFREP